jgi:hypothetical protein
MAEAQPVEKHEGGRAQLDYMITLMLRCNSSLAMSKTKSRFNSYIGACCAAATFRFPSRCDWKFFE